MPELWKCVKWGWIANLTIWWEVKVKRKFCSFNASYQLWYKSTTWTIKNSQAEILVGEQKKKENMLERHQTGIGDSSIQMGRTHLVYCWEQPKLKKKKHKARTYSWQKDKLEQHASALLRSNCHTVNAKGLSTLGMRTVWWYNINTFLE